MPLPYPARFLYTAAEQLTAPARGLVSLRTRAGARSSCGCRGRHTRCGGCRRPSRLATSSAFSRPGSRDTSQSCRERSEVYNRCSKNLHLHLLHGCGHGWWRGRGGHTPVISVHLQQPHQLQGAGRRVLRVEAGGHGVPHLPIRCQYSDPCGQSGVSISPRMRTWPASSITTTPSRHAHSAASNRSNCCARWPLVSDHSAMSSLPPKPPSSLKVCRVTCYLNTVLMSAPTCQS